MLFSNRLTSKGAMAVLDMYWRAYQTRAGYGSSKLLQFRPERTCEVLFRTVMLRYYSAAIRGDAMPDSMGYVFVRKREIAGCSCWIFFPGVSGMVVWGYVGIKVCYCYHLERLIAKRKSAKSMNALLDHRTILSWLEWRILAHFSWLSSLASSQRESANLYLVTRISTSVAVAV